MGCDFHLMEKKAIEEIEKEAREYVNECLLTHPFPPEILKVISSYDAKVFVKEIDDFKRDNPGFYQTGNTKMITRHPFFEADPIRFFVAVLVKI